MPTSAKPNKAEEFFVEDKDGKRQDAPLHDPILKDGDAAKATAVGMSVAVRLGLSPERAARLMLKKQKQK